jgi:predicted amidohydrolase
MVPVFCDKYDIAQKIGTFPVEQKQRYDKYDIAQNTGTIPAEQKQPYDKYDIAQNTGTIHVEGCFCSAGMVPVFCAISYLS